jgi:hypothetical protein
MISPILDQLSGYISDNFVDELITDIAHHSEVQIGFVLRSEVGVLGFEIILEETEEAGILEITALPLLAGGEKLHPYDLCGINLQGYEVLDEIGRTLVWSRLVLNGEESGSKEPAFMRTEIIEFLSDTNTHNYNHVIHLIEYMRDEAVLATPLLARLACGEQVDAPALSLSLTEAEGSVQ